MELPEGADRSTVSFEKFLTHVQRAGGIRDPKTSPTTQVVFQKLRREIFILQLVWLALTYNFTDCSFEKIREEYDKVIYQALHDYMKKTKSTGFSKLDYCKDWPDCLTHIVRVTFNLTHGCTSLAKEIAAKTTATLTQHCPDYSGNQVNNTQMVKKRMRREITTNKCLEHVTNLVGLWRRFSRISPKQNKSSLL